VPRKDVARRSTMLAPEAVGIHGSLRRMFAKNRPDEKHGQASKADYHYHH